MSRFGSPELAPVERIDDVPAAIAGVDAEVETAKKPRVFEDKFAFACLVVFSLLYYGRPEDWIPFVAKIPLAKIIGILLALALIKDLLTRPHLKLPLKAKLLVALVIWMAICVPFATWRGGAMDEVRDFAKVVIPAVVMMLTVSNIDRLRKILWVHCAAVATLCFVSLAAYQRGRMGGSLGGIFENPNDLALATNAVLPLCIGFFLLTKRPLFRILWAIGILSMLRTIIVTYSRAGFMELILCSVIMLWLLAVKEKRRWLIGAAIGAVILLAIFAPAHYSERLQSIFQDNVKWSRDHGSADERKEILKRSWEITLAHPIVGIGPGNFPIFSGNWLVTHNSYTQQSSETGLPGFFLLLAMIFTTLRELSFARKNAPPGSEARMYANMLTAGIVAYAFGMFFGSMAYQYLTYFLFSYATVTYLQVKGEMSVTPVESSQMGDLSEAVVQRQPDHLDTATDGDREDASGHWG